jgi:hypothetical protein
MEKALERVLDAIDIETYIISKDEEEAKKLSLMLLAELNLPHGDIVFLEHKGAGARVRLRSYVHHPGDHYHWLEKKAGEL